MIFSSDNSKVDRSMLFVQYLCIHKNNRCYGGVVMKKTLSLDFTCRIYIDFCLVKLIIAYLMEPCDTFR